MNNKDVMNSMLRSTVAGKMNIGPDGKMELTPEMMETLGISKESLQNGDLEINPDKAYETIKLSDVPKRPITDEEYAAMPGCCKKGLHQLLSIGYVFALIVTAMMIFFIYTNEELRANNLAMTYGACVFIILLDVFITIKSITKGLSRNSSIAVGNVVFCDVHKRSGGKFHYYLTVSLPESKQCVQRVSCSRSTYNKVKVGSKVYLNNKHAYAAQK